jgi:hypothetical protein
MGRSHRWTRQRRRGSARKRMRTPTRFGRWFVVYSRVRETETLPPPSLLNGFKRVWAQVACEKHLAPPSCPSAAEATVRPTARRVPISTSMSADTATPDGDTSIAKQVSAVATQFGPVSNACDSDPSARCGRVVEVSCGTHCGPRSLAHRRFTAGMVAAHDEAKEGSSPG